MTDLKELVKTGGDKGTEAMVIKLSEEGKAAEVILNEALIPALDEVDELYQKGEYFLPERLIASRAAQRGIDILRPRLKEKDIKVAGLRANVKIIVGGAPVTQKFADEIGADAVAGKDFARSVVASG